MAKLKVILHVLFTCLCVYLYMKVFLLLELLHIIKNIYILDVLRYGNVNEYEWIWMTIFIFNEI